MSIIDNLNRIKTTIPREVALIAVSKTHTAEAIMEAYSTGHRVFGENKVQELCTKQLSLPKDIDLYRYILPIVTTSRSVENADLP